MTLELHLRPFRDLLIPFRELHPDLLWKLQVDLNQTLLRPYSDLTQTLLRPPPGPREGVK